MKNKNFTLRFRSVFFLFLMSLVTLPLFSQNETSRVVSLDLQDIMANLQDVPTEEDVASKKKNPKSMALPMPDGSERSFMVVQNDLMAPDFAAAFPELKTYSMQAVDDPTVFARLTVSPHGIRSSIFTSNGIITVSPVDELNPVLHRSQFSEGAADFACGVTEDLDMVDFDPSMRVPSFNNGATKITYGFAIVTTGEYYQLHSSSIPAAQAAATAAVNDIEAIFERELAVNFTVPTPFIFTDPSSDPWVPGGSNRLALVAQAIGNNFTNTQYQIGHCLHGTGNLMEWGGGVAGLGALCNDGLIPGFNPGRWKGQGWSSMPGTDLPQELKIFAHEVGHQFSMPHTWNGVCTDPAMGNQIGDAYEIGSGSTIMSYNGVCWQPNSNIGNPFREADNYFHNISLQRAVTHMANNASCGTTSSTGNTPPVVDANPGACGSSFTIPKGTPFRLNGSGSDANGDQVYYCWEQFDEDGAGNPTQGFLGAQAAASMIAPLFRSYPPTTSPSRTFPHMSLVAANNYASNFEPLPTVARTMKFRLTGRDYHTGGGGINFDSLVVNVSASGPFSVTAPNGGENLTAGNSTTVTWAVNGTNAFSSNVNIRMSIDGGSTYPYTLATATPNDGSHSVTIPSGVTNTTMARMMVESAANTCVVFFDISNSDFTITSSCNAPSISEISPDNAVFLPTGSGGLNLNLTNNIGSEVTSFSGSITVTDTPGNLIFLNGTPAVCDGPSNANYLDVHQFTVDMPGSYTIEHGGPFLTVLNLYQAPYTGSNCTNHISSSATRPSGSGIIQVNAGLTATLSPNVIYVLVESSFSQSSPTLPFNYDITFPTKPAGAKVYNGVILPTGYSYTYLAVNTANNQVAAVNATSNFTSLPAGSYKVYGAAYYSGSAPPTPATPGSWTGQTLSAVIGGSACVSLSINCKPVTVTGGGGSYCAAGATATSDEKISNVQFNTINNPSTSTGGYEDFTAVSTSVAQGSTHNFTGTITGGVSSDEMIVWIDLNQDNDFEDAGEEVFNSPTGAGPTYSSDITIPPTATTGNTRMRVRLHSTNVNEGPNATPCGNSTYGQVEDYTITITSGCTAPAVSALTVTQPTCAVPTGTIVVNATGGGTLEYSKDNGTTWQPSATFGSLAPGSYSIKVRLQASPTCMTAYASNPVVLLTPTGCGGYCAAGATSTCCEKISNVQFNTINNPSTSTGGTRISRLFPLRLHRVRPTLLQALLVPIIIRRMKLSFGLTSTRTMISRMQVKRSSIHQTASDRTAATLPYRPLP